MANARGSPFILLALLLGGWVFARAAQYEAVSPQMESPESPFAAEAVTAPLATDSAVHAPANEDGVASAFAARLPNGPQQHPAGARHAFSKLAAIHAATQMQRQHGSALLTLSGPTEKGDTAISSVAFPAFVQQQDSRITPPALSAPLHLAPLRNSKHSVYAYSFWRIGQSDKAAPFAGQYGASQTAIIGTYQLGGRLARASLLWRLSYVPSAPAQSEFAFGARLQPLQSIPLTISAERRIQADGQGRFSTYVSAFKDNVAMPAGFKLAGYGQVGIVSRGLGSGKSELFHDANLKINRAVYRGPALDAAIGAGIWAGGQKGIGRLDIGPTVHTRIHVGSSQFRIDADWRFRIKGAAQPGSGPALTLSTSF